MENYVQVNESAEYLFKNDQSVAPSGLYRSSRLCNDASTPNKQFNAEHWQELQKNSTKIWNMILQ